MPNKTVSKALRQSPTIKKTLAYQALKELFNQTSPTGQSLLSKFQEIYPDLTFDSFQVAICAFEKDLEEVSSFNIYDAYKIYDLKMKERSKVIREEITNNFDKDENNSKKIDEKLKQAIDLAIILEKPKIAKESKLEALHEYNKLINKKVRQLLNELKPIFIAAIFLVFETKQMQIIAKWKGLILKAASEKNIQLDEVNTLASEIHFTRALALLRSGMPLNEDVSIFKGLNLTLKEYFESYLIRVLFTSDAITELLDESLLAILKCFVLRQPERLEILSNNVHIYATSPEHVDTPSEFWQAIQLIRTNENNNGIMQKLLTKFKEFYANDEELGLILKTWLSEDIKLEETKKVDLACSPSIECQKSSEGTNAGTRRRRQNYGKFYSPLPLPLVREDTQSEWQAIQPVVEQVTRSRLKLGDRPHRPFLTQSSPAATQSSLERSTVRISVKTTSTFP